MKKILFAIVSYLVLSSLASYILASGPILTTLFFPEKKLCFELGDWFCRWGAFDGVHYSEIAIRSYRQFEHSFLPFWPILIHIYTIVFAYSPVVIARILSIIFLALGLYGMQKIGQKYDKKFDLPLLLICIFTFPTAFYLLTAYNDAFFLCLVVWFFLVGESKKYFFQSLLLGIALLTRMNGAGIYLYFLLTIILAKKISTTKKLIYLLLPLIAVGGYLWYCRIYFDDFLAPLTAMRQWGRGVFTFPLITVARYGKIFYYNSWWEWQTGIALLELLSFGFYLFLIYKTWKFLPKKITLLSFLILIIPILSGTFQGMGRYIFHAPFLLILYANTLQQWTHTKKAILLAIMTILQLVLLAGFLQGYFVA